ncbi:unnamed protein product, partial [Symbiodinium natans]
FERPHWPRARHRGSNPADYEEGLEHVGKVPSLFDRQVSHGRANRRDGHVPCRSNGGSQRTSLQVQGTSSDRRSSADTTGPVGVRTTQSSGNSDFEHMGPLGTARQF